MAPKQNYNKANYQKNTNLVQEHQFQGQHPTVARTKTDGRIGSATPPQFLKGGLTVNNNDKAQPHSGTIGAVAAKHMSAGHTPGQSYAPRAAKARAMASAGRKAMSRPHTEPINNTRGPLKRIRPD